jgi:hypothetical protein
MALMLLFTKILVGHLHMLFRRILGNRLLSLKHHPSLERLISAISEKFLAGRSSTFTSAIQRCMGYSLVPGLKAPKPEDLLRSTVGENVRLAKESCSR